MKTTSLLLSALLLSLILLATGLNRTAAYALESVGAGALTPTETATATTEPEPEPEPEPTVTATATLAVAGDACEPNDDFSAPCPLMLNQPLTNLTLSPVGDRDHFAVYLKAGQLARAATFPAPGSGTDTRLFVYSQSGNLLGENEDRGPTDLGSTVAWTATADGFYIILVESAIPFSGRYDLLVSLEAPAATATPPATATPLPTTTPVPTATPPIPPDSAEPNNRPENAYEIVAGATYNLTLGPRGFDDHDFFKLLVKTGNQYRCTARPNGPLDPALRVYAGPIGAGVLIAANDDVSPTDRGSLVTFAAPETGFVFVVAEVQAGAGAYSLLCDAVVPAPGGGSGNGAGRPAATPTPEPTATLPPTATPIQVQVRPLPALTPTAVPLPATTIRIQVVYDLNANNQPDPDEGIANVSVRAVSRNSVVGWALTDERGLASLTILGEVDRVIVPFLSGWSRTVRLGEVNEIVLPVPAVPLPVIMPVVNE
jgi:hypothetical protein